MKKLLAIVSLLMLTISLNAQEMCGFDSLYNNLINDPVQKESFDLINNAVTRYVNEHQNQTLGINADYVIPVVVHIVEPTLGAFGITYAQVLSQIDALNAAYNGDYTYQGLGQIGIDTRIQFCLATQVWDASTNAVSSTVSFPAGEPGVMRWDASLYSGDISNHIRNQISQDNLIEVTNDFSNGPGNNGNIFPFDKYLNIWVVNSINGALGYAPTPIDSLLNGISTNLDGVVIQAGVFGDNSNPSYPGNFLLNIPGFPSSNQYKRDEGKILSHEVGHYLFLIHTFQFGCSGTQNIGFPDPCDIGGDFLCDTYPCTEPSDYFCTTDPNRNSCNETTTLSGNDQQNNFMFYNEDPCLNTFTNDQKLRMQGFIQTDNRRTAMVSHANHVDVGLIATGCVDPLLTAEFTINPASACINTPVSFQTPSGLGYTANQWSWDFGDGTILPFSPTNNSVNHNYLVQGSYTVTLTASDGSNQILTSQPIFVSDCDAIQSTQGNWYFGRRCAIDFNTGIGVGNTSAFIPTPTINSDEAAVSVSDNMGNLLFYTDGNLVWNSSHQQITGSIGGNLSTGQILAVPNPANANQYYLFTPPALEDGYTGFEYTIINTSGVVSIGSTTSLDPFLPNPARGISEGITAIPHCNGIDYWIIVIEGNNAGASNNSFLVYRLSNIGLTNADFTSINTPNSYTFNIPHYGGGQLKASPDGSKIVYPRSGNGVSVLDFNSSTGVISNLQVLTNGTGIVSGTSFSPNSQYIYSSIANDNYWIRYDLLNGTFINIMTSFGISNYGYRFLQLTPEIPARIFATSYSDHLILSIDNPDALTPNVNLSAIDFLTLGITPVTNLVPQVGIPNFIDAIQPPVNPNFTYTQTSCSTVDFQVDECWADYNLLWNFGDGIGTSTLPNPSYTYTSTGTFNVQLTLSLGTFSQIITQSVTTNSSSPLIINGPLSVCDGNISSYDIVNAPAGFINNWTITGGVFGNNTTSFTGITTLVSWNSSGGTITINSTNGGCNITTVVNVTVNQPPVLTTTVIDDNCASCSGSATVNVTSGTGSYTYYWSNNQTTATATNLCAGNYDVIVTDGNGCSTKAVVVINDTPCIINPDCTLPTTIILPNGATSTTLIPNNAVVEVQGLFTITNTVAYTNVKFKMAAGARINILSGNTLTLRKCHLFSCTQLWQEITVNPNANLVVLRYTIIEDAEQAIHWMDGGAVIVNRSIFNRNGAGLHLETNFSNTVAPNVVVRNSIFTCRDFPASLYLPPFFTPGSFNALKSNLFNNNLSLYPYGSLIAPAPANTRSLYGVISSQVAATIGVTGTANNRNLFDYLDFGIQVTNANFTVINNAFANLSGFDGSTVATPGNLKGIGVFARTKSGFNITIGGNNLLTRNQFRNCYRGANLTNYSTINFINNTLTNTTTSPTFVPPTLNIGHFGLAIFSTVAGPSINLNYTINNNTIDNNATGIFINSVYSSINSQNIQLGGNNLNVTGSGTYCNQGIWMQGLAGSSVINGAVNVANNTVRNSEINALLFENVNSGLNVNLNNELSVAFNTNKSKQVIRLNNCSDAVITSNGNITTTNNTTIPTGTDPINFITGIFLNNCQSSLVTCNTINFVNTCVIFDLPNSNSQFSGNTMNKAQYGLVLANGAIIGPQGTPTQPSGNEWGPNNPANITINHTYTLNTSGVNINSPLYCKPNVITNCTTGGLKTFPCSNGANIATNEYQLGVGLFTATGLPQATCTGKPGNPLANAKALLHEADSGNGNAVDKFLKKRQAFHLIKTDQTGNLMADNELSTFFIQEQTQNIGKLSTTNELISNNNWLAAKNTNSSITPSNVADYNLKAVNEIWLQSMLDTAYVLTTADSSILYTIGNICIQQGGDATVLARSLLANFTQTALTFTDCFELPFGNGTNRLTDTTQTSNLILNGSFEFVDTTVPPNFNAAIPWISPQWGSPNIHTPNDIETMLNTGHQTPQHGLKYASGYYFWKNSTSPPNASFREPVIAKTSVTLNSGVQYCLSYYISLADTFNCAVNRSDAYFSPTPMDPTLSSSPYLMYVQPHVMADSTVFYTDKENWTKIEGSYTASGGENYITFGNLHLDNETDTLCNGSMASSGYPNDRDAFYYMDNFSLEEIIPVNAGADVSIIDGDSVLIGNNLDSASSYSWLPNSYINDVNTLNPAVNPPVTTTYYVTKTQCSVVTTDSVTVFVNAVGVAPSPLERAGVRIFPNPNNGTFTITHNLKGENYVLEIVDLMGKVVHREKLSTGTQQEIKTQLLNKGIYFVNIKSEVGELVYSSKMSVMR